MLEAKYILADLPNGSQEVLVGCPMRCINFTLLYPDRLRCDLCLIQLFCELKYGLNTPCANGFTDPLDDLIWTKRFSEYLDGLSPASR
jgi:hypothetical protein